MRLIDVIQEKRIAYQQRIRSSFMVNHIIKTIKDDIHQNFLNEKIVINNYKLRMNLEDSQNTLEANKEIIEKYCKDNGLKFSFNGSSYIISWELKP